MILGMDFGTTNTGAAMFDGDAIRLLPLDPASPTPQICRSAIYMTRAGDFYLGSAALNTYFDQNVGRATRYKKIWIGEILQVFAELPHFYRDIYVFEDEFSPGRLFVSIKSGLRNKEYFGTAFQDNWYTPSDLVAVFLTGMKMRLERHLDAPLREIVLGRPVHFSEKPEEDSVAQGRLLEAAFKAGFEKVYLEYEPVAAALSYERTLSDKETVLVFDFGGGTLDFTIMEIGAPGQRQVLATGGIPIAGDVFDRRLFRGTIPKHLGEGDYFVTAGRRYPIPTHFFELLADPHEILTLNLPHNLEKLQSIHQGSVHKEKTHALLRVVTSNYALRIFDLVERAKCELSSEQETRLLFDAQDFTIEERIPRAGFEKAISPDYELIREELFQTLSRSGLTPGEINRVIRTGGSSQIPLFVRLLNEIFGAEKVRLIDVFSSVTSGLAIRGHQIERGLVEAQAYTPETGQRLSEKVAEGERQAEASPVNLETVRKRLQIRLDLSEGQIQIPEYIWLTLEGGEMRALSAAKLKTTAVYWADGENQLTAVGPYLTPQSKVLLLPGDRHVLLITDQFKFISVQVRDLYLAEQAVEKGSSRTLPLEKGEMVAAMTGWQPEQGGQILVCMVTNTGQARCFDARLLAGWLMKKPYFQLERQYLGQPVELFLTGEQDLVLVGTNSGRMAGALAATMSVNALELLKLRKAEQVTAAACASAGGGVLVVNDQGEGISLEPEDAILSGETVNQGMLLRRNFQIAAFVSEEEARLGAALALTSLGWLVRIDTRVVTQPLSRQHPKPVCEMLDNEKILTVIGLDDTTPARPGYGSISGMKTETSQFPT